MIPFEYKEEEVKEIMRSLPRDENIEVFCHQVTGSSYDEWSDRHWRASSSFYRLY